MIRFMGFFSAMYTPGMLISAFDTPFKPDVFIFAS
jgi:hypothetical protein